MSVLTSKSLLDTVRPLVRAAEPAALLIEPRILRRVIRLDRRLAGLGLSVPHHHCYTIERERLLAFADRQELELAATAELPRTVILLAKPSSDERAERESTESWIRHYSRLLLHSRAHASFGKLLQDDRPGSRLADQRRRQIGELEFAEIQAVLVKDEFLFPEPTELETYIEFAALYLELKYFSPDDLPVYFPSIRDWQPIEAIIGQDLDHRGLFASSMLVASSSDLQHAPHFPSRSGSPPSGRHRRPFSAAKLRRLRQRAERARGLGNSVKAAILATRMAEAGAGPSAAAGDRMQELARRLGDVLQFTPEETDQWAQALIPLLEPAARGFWSAEARLLYDLQKVCVQKEKGVFQLSLRTWLKSGGRDLGRSPLPLLRDVLITKHLRTAGRRLASAHIAAGDRLRLDQLLAAAIHSAEQRSRDHVRPLIVRVLDEVGLVPANLPEQVSRDKLVEELLDGVVEHGFLNMGDLRDALSKNDLKLPDLAGPRELARGDRLLRADRKLAAALQGVYRPGAIYLRLPQRVSSIAFGTKIGRFATQYIVLPYGGAFLMLEGLRHLGGFLRGHPRELSLGPPASVEEAAHAVAPPGGWSIVAVLVVGTLLLMLLHRPPFRAWCLRLVQIAGRAARNVLVDLPARLFRSPFIQRLLESQVYSAIRGYLIRPSLLSALIILPTLGLGVSWNVHLILDLFLASALLLNSPVGRYTDEWITDLLVRTWHELRMRVFAALFHWIMETFHRLLTALERLVYSVDEWLRFRAGDSRLSETVKMVGGTVWFFVSYLIVFIFTLLVEPQINPIKHFPVVTVAHKLILPTGPMFVRQLSPYTGTALANTLVWSTIWMVPGVFGFLVWELKENWRLYAANRSPQLVPAAIGHHGETMFRLLRPRFHSGTLPKLFSGLRRATRKAEQTGDWKPVNRKRAALLHVEDAVRRFVHRELCNLVNQARILPHDGLTIGAVRLSTCRVEIELLLQRSQAGGVWLVWEEQAGQLEASLVRGGWMDRLSKDQRRKLEGALLGFFQRAGADRLPDLQLEGSSEPVSWSRWLAFWADYFIPRPLPAPIALAAPSRSTAVGTAPETS